MPERNSILEVLSRFEIDVDRASGLLLSSEQRRPKPNVFVETSAGEQAIDHATSSVPPNIRPIETGFSDACVWQVGGFALRRWPADASLEWLRGVHQLLSQILDAGVAQVPKPVSSRTGETIIRDIHNRLWQLEPWMPGEATFRNDPNAVRRRVTFETLARWHNESCRFAQNENRASTSEFGYAEQTCPTIQARSELLQSHGSMLRQFEEGLGQERHDRFRQLGHEIVAAFRRLQATIARDLNSVSSLAVRTFPAIRDLWHDHLLFTGDDLTGLIDFGAVRPESVACDLSRLIGSLFADNQVERLNSLDDYQNVRRLTTNELRLIAPLDRSGLLLSGTTWLERRYVQRQPFKNIDRVCDRLEAIADRLQSQLQ